MIRIPADNKEIYQKFVLPSFLLSFREIPLLKC
jgi:hypothetical protein